MVFCAVDGYDEGVLAFEGGDEGTGVVIINVLDDDVLGEGACAFGAGEGCNGVLVGREKGGGYVGAAAAAGLDISVIIYILRRRDKMKTLTPTMATFLM